MKLSCRTLPGVLTVHNKGTLDWANHGLLAYGSTNVVAVLDSNTLRLIHGLNGHKTAVTKVRWMPSTQTGDSAKSRSLFLASSDTGGTTLVWDVFTASVKHTLAENNRVVNGLEWLVRGRDAFILLLYQPSTLVLWNAFTGEQVWKKHYADALNGFCLDPFDANHAAFQGVGFILFINDLSVTKCPHSNGKKFQISSLGSSSPAEKENASAMRDLTQMLYHRSYRNHLMLVNSHEIIIIDLDIKHATGVVCLEKAYSPFQQVWSCRQRDVLYGLHESGCISMRLRKKRTAAARSASCETAGSQSVDGSGETAPSGLILPCDRTADIYYDLLLVTDNPRLSRSQRAVSMAVCPMTESRLAVLSSDGKLMIYDFQKERDWAPPCQDAADGLCSDFLAMSPPVMCLADLVPPSTSRNHAVRGSEELRSARPLCTASLVSIANGLPEPPLVVRMCPPLTTRNWNVYQPLLAVGSQKGVVQIYNLSSGSLQKEISVHSCQVRGIEWTAMSSFVSFAHDTAGGSGGSSHRSELAHVDLRTGRVTTFKTCTTEETAITAIRVSYLKQYLIVLYKGKQAELWDARSLTLLREMPQIFPYVTTLEWSNSARRASSETAGVPSDGDGATSASTAAVSGATAARQQHQPLCKEHLLATDEQGFVHSFTVEGTAVNLMASVGISGSITAMAWKVETLVLGSSEGLLSFMDLKARTTQVRSTDRGHVRKLRFAPGKGNKILLVLLHKELQVWDSAELSHLSSLRFPKDVSRVSDVDWANSDMPVFSAADGYVTVTKMDLKTHNTSLGDTPAGVLAACAALLSPSDRLASKTLLSHQPWKQSLSFDADDSGNSGVQSSADLAKCLSGELRKYMLSSRCSIAERCLVVARMLGDRFETDFWTVALHYLCLCRTTAGVCFSSSTVEHANGSESLASAPADGRNGRECTSSAGSVSASCQPGVTGVVSYAEPLEACYDLFCDNASYRDAELARVMAHDSRRASTETSSHCASKYILLGETDRAVHLLLDTDPASPHYLTNCLKACLLTSAKTSGASLSTIKLVATNLIASGKLSEGVLLLCLIDKGLDACRYLQTYGHWDDSVQLAKLLLGPTDYTEVIGRWIDHLCSPNVNRKERAILAALSTTQFVRAIELLYGSHCFSTAALFAEACVQFGVLDSSERTQHIVEAVFQQYARVLREHGLSTAADYYQTRASPCALSNGCRGNGDVGNSSSSPSIQSSPAVSSSGLGDGDG